MKKILFVVESLAGGGAEKVLLTLVKNLDKTKYDVTVFSLVKTGVYVNEISKHCKLIYALDDYSNLNFVNKCIYRLKSKYIYKFNSKIVYKSLIKDKYDIEVAFIEGFSTKLVASSNNSISKKYAWIHTNMITNPHADIHYKNLEQQKFFYDNFNKIFAVSKDVKNSFIKKFSNNNIVVQYNPVDSKEITNLSLEYQELIRQSDFNMISIGRLEYQKGYERLLNILKRLKEENYIFKLYIFGIGSLKNEFESFIKNNDLSEYIYLMGFTANPYKYLVHADAFLCSSYSEGFSTVATESMILGVPIITTDCSGMRELFGNHECGIITRNDEESLYNAIKMVLDNNDLLKKYKNDVLKRREFFDINNRIKEIEEIFDEG